MVKPAFCSYTMYAGHDPPNPSFLKVLGVYAVGCHIVISHLIVSVILQFYSCLTVEDIMTLMVIPSHTDVTAFLDNMVKGLEQIFSSTGWFKPLNSVLTSRMCELGASIEGITGKAQQLCQVC